MIIENQIAEKDEEPFLDKGLFDEQSFEKFFKQHFLALCVYCQHKYGFDLELAKDAVHNGFIRLWETKEFISKGRSPKAYMYKIVQNICVDIIRHNKVRFKKERLLLGSEMGKNSINGFDQSELKNLSEAIDKAVSELPDQMRKVFELCRYKGLKYVEVAVELNISPKTVETQMGRALKKLRQRLSDYLLIALILLFPGNF